MQGGQLNEMLALRKYRDRARRFADGMNRLLVRNHIGLAHRRRLTRLRPAYRKKNSGTLLSSFGHSPAPEHNGFLATVTKPLA